jgi:hypothetical protein
LNLARPILALFRFNKRNWRAVLLSILAATIFWFFNALNKDYSANIDFPIAFRFDQANYIPVEPLPESVTLNVTGLGWDLFRRSVGLKIPPLLITLDRPSDVKKIVASTLPVLFTSQLEGIKINYVLTDTVYLHIEPRVSKTIRLKMDSIDLHLRKDYGLAGPVVLKPDTAHIEGPQSLVQAFPDTLRMHVEDNQIDQPFDDILQLRMPSPLLKVQPPVVGVQFQVERYVTVEDTLVLKIINVPHKARTFVESSQVHAIYRLLEDQAKTIQPDSIIATLDLSTVSRGRKKFLPVISGLPSTGQVLEVDSVTVNF